MVEAHRAPAHLDRYHGRRVDRVDELEEVHRGVVTDVTMRQHPAVVRTGEEPHAPVLDVDVVERHPHAEGVVREARLPVRLVLVPRDREAAHRWFEDQVAPALDGRLGRSDRRAASDRVRHMSVSCTPTTRRSGNSNCPRSGSSSEPYGFATSKRASGKPVRRCATNVSYWRGASEFLVGGDPIEHEVSVLGEERHLVVVDLDIGVHREPPRVRKDRSLARQEIDFNHAPWPHARRGGASSRARPASGAHDVLRHPAARPRRRGARRQPGRSRRRAGSRRSVAGSTSVARGESSNPTIATSSGTAAGHRGNARNAPTVIG